jgi:NAD(P)-dependent dehydrogenase (short-subunit alcohol dehydrogenase family)
MIYMAAALDVKVVLITGGSAGIGKAAAKLFAEAGASVAFAARGAERGQRVEQELRQAGLDVRFVRADVSQSEQVQDLIAQTVKKFGGLIVRLIMLLSWVRTPAQPISAMLISMPR